MNNIAQTLFWGELIGKIMFLFFAGTTIVGSIFCYIMVLNCAYEAGEQSAIDDFNNKHGIK